MAYFVGDFLRAVTGLIPLYDPPHGDPRTGNSRPATAHVRSENN